MSLFNSVLSTHSFSKIASQGAGSLSESVSFLQTKTVLIALAIFALIAAAVGLAFYCLRGKKGEPLKADTSPEPATHFAAAPVVDKTAVSLLKPETAQKAPVAAASEKATEVKVTISPAKTERKTKSSASKELPPEEADEELDDLQDDQLYDLNELPESDDYMGFEDDNYVDTPYKPPKKKVSQTDPKFVIIDGKSISWSTLKCRKKLEQDLKALGKVAGEAIDNGDCFWISFAKCLSRLRNTLITLKQVREAASKFVKELDKGPEKDNWLKHLIETEYASMETYEDYRDCIAYNVAECLAKEKPIIWGKADRECLFLCHIFKVNLRVYEARCLDEDSTDLDNLENVYRDDHTYPEGESYPQTIEIAGYPGHFFPVWDK